MKNIVIEIKQKKIDEINSSLGKMKVEFLNQKCLDTFSKNSTENKKNFN